MVHPDRPADLRRATATGTSGCPRTALSWSPSTTSPRSIRRSSGCTPRGTLYYMAKIELLRVPIAGELLRWTGAFAVRRGEGDRDSLRVARWALVERATSSASSPRERGSACGYPGPMHAGAAMLAIQEGVPIVPCGHRHVRVDRSKNRRRCASSGASRSSSTCRGTARATRKAPRSSRSASPRSGGRPPRPSQTGSRRCCPTVSGAHGPVSPRNSIIHPELPNWPTEEWAEEPLGPVYRAERDYTAVTKTLRRLFARRRHSP